LRSPARCQYRTSRDQRIRPSAETPSALKQIGASQCSCNERSLTEMLVRGKRYQIKKPQAGQCRKVYLLPNGVVATPEPRSSSKPLRYSRPSNQTKHASVTCHCACALSLYT
jgi:hypothetical protein